MKKFLVYYFLFLYTLFVSLSSGVIDSQDGFQYLAVARNIYYTGQPTAPIYEFDHRKNIHMSTYIGKDGNTYSPTGLGYSLALVPAVAATDVIYKINGVAPPTHFPLESDWLVLLLASFTNSFFAALLGVVLFLYLQSLGLTKKQSLFISLAGLLGTNLIVYAKNSFAHMMFISFLFLSFFLVRRYFQTSKKWYLVFGGMSFGLMAITYNQTFILSMIPMGIYFLALSKIKFTITFLKEIFTKYLLFFLGVLPFIFIYLGFENLRAADYRNLANPLEVAAKGVNPLADLPIGVFFEGLYGQLFSPGRSIFLYSPILLLIIFYWHKIKKVIFPELIVFLALSAIYILFLGSQVGYGAPGQGIAGFWHGESSWGPRYLTPLLPFGLLVVGYIFSKLKFKERIFIVIPFFLVGFYVNMLGIIMPYQIKFHDLQDKFYVNATEFTNFAYSNFIPRYSPVIMMSKKLAKLPLTLPKTFNHGEYNVKFYDGVDFPFPVGPERWRVIEEKGYISLDNSTKDPIKKISLGLINHPMEEASYSATVKVSLNGQILGEKEFLPTQRELLEYPIEESVLHQKDNQLTVDVSFKSLQGSEEQTEVIQYKDDPALYTNKNTPPKKSVSQILGLITFAINDKEVNRESIDVPYVSALGPSMTGANYQTYGGTNKDPWKIWEIHTQIYERVPDFWWFKFFYYWDVPRLQLIALFIGIVALSGYFGIQSLREIKKD